VQSAKASSQWRIPSFADFLAAEAKAEALRSAFAGYFQKFDVLLLPGQSYDRHAARCTGNRRQRRDVPWTHVMRATSPLNLAGLSALSEPYGFSSQKLPIGIQLVVSKWLDEATILRLGALLEPHQKGLVDQLRGPSISFVGRARIWAN
jgi:aspartyl-tRNA(Asn)/glutamyl-tRNA(Gln) amidotransferase subunit A